VYDRKMTEKSSG